MKFSSARWLAAVAIAAMLAACGDSDDGDDGVTPPPPTASLKTKIDAAAANSANDTSTNSSASFIVLQDAGVPAVTVKSPPKVNFTVFSDGAVKSGLALSNMSFAIAKIVPGSGGNPDEWVSYVYRTETPPANVGPGGAPVLASAQQATSDPKPAAQAATQLVWNADGYYTYTFSTDITDPTKTRGVVFEPGLTHRVAIQLSYTNAAGETVRVNPYFDFTVDANGNSVTVTDPSKTRKMADVSSCNSCHDKLALHGGGRVDVQYCVMCHNPGTTDANSGNVLTMATMVHKIHAGRLLHTKKNEGKGGEDYVIWGFSNSMHDYSEVGFPQDLRNCTKCHSGDNPSTPQGGNWKTQISKGACLTCHASGSGSEWKDGSPATDTTPAKAGHDAYAAQVIGSGATGDSLTNAQCRQCHSPSSNPAISPERVHWNQNEENAAKYKMVIESATYDPNTRNVTVKYHLADPTNNNAKYNLVTPDCVYPAPGVCQPPSGTNNTKFGNLRLYVAYQNMVGQSTAVTEFSAYNNGGSSANVFASRGTNDGSNNYTIDIPLPADSAIAVAAGSARVVSLGQVKEVKLQVKSAADPRPPETPQSFVNTVAQHTYKDFAISGALNPRRQVVSNDKCNACHGALGTTSGSNTLANAFHSGARNTVEACMICHDANRASSTVMTNGTAMQESYHFKRMIHGIHGNSKRMYPFTHGNAVVGAFCNPANAASQPPACDSSLQLASGVEDYAAEVIWPGVGINCNACHVDNSYKNDRGALASTVSPRVTGADPRTYLAISPKAASCTACHDSSTAIGHVTAFGGAAWGNLTQAQILAAPQETCNDCHSPGGFKGVDVVHGQK